MGSTSPRCRGASTRPLSDAPNSRSRAPAAFAAFDLLALDGRDLRLKVDDERRALLAELLDGLSTNIGLMPRTDNAGAVRVWMTGQPGVEGCVAKRRDQVYKPGKRA